MAGFEEYERFDGLGLAGLVRGGEISPAELLEAAIERVEARNPTVNAVVMELYDRARDAIAAGLPEGPFTGVPYLVKDLSVAVAGTPTTRASRFFADAVPSEDSEHVNRLKRSGLVIFGKTSTCELGLSLTCESQFYGPTRNPWDRDRIAGGSSGGAAAAVGSRMLPMAHASDGFGSIRAPAACCGARGAEADAWPQHDGAVPRRRSCRPRRRPRGDPSRCATAPPCSMSRRGQGRATPMCRPHLRPGATSKRPRPAQSVFRIAFTSKAPNGGTVDPEPLRVLEETAKLCSDLGHHVEPADPQNRRRRRCIDLPHADGCQHGCQPVEAPKSPAERLARRRWRRSPGAASRRADV